MTPEGPTFVPKQPLPPEARQTAIVPCTMRQFMLCGSGLAIIPFLHGVVDEYHWLTRHARSR